MSFHCPFFVFPAELCRHFIHYHYIFPQYLPLYALCAFSFLTSKDLHVFSVSRACDEYYDGLKLARDRAPVVVDEINAFKFMSSDSNEQTDYSE